MLGDIVPAANKTEKKQKKKIVRSHLINEEETSEQACSGITIFR